MDISKHLLVGESIHYAKEEIISSILDKEFPSKRNWYGVTTTFEENNLFYIISGSEYRHPMYHRECFPSDSEDKNAGKELKLLAIAGSRNEALDLVQDMILQMIKRIKKESFKDMKKMTEEW